MYQYEKYSTKVIVLDLYYTSNRELALSVICVAMEPVPLLSNLTESAKK
jgi:hypothetical protein